MPKRDGDEKPPSPPRSEKGAATRARLIDAAKGVFEETGFLDARISDIAKAAGLSHGSFYHYFASKEQIFREVAEAQEARLTARDGEEGEETDDASGGTASRRLTEIERIHRANRRYLERYRENAKIMDVIEEVSRYDAAVRDARMQRQRHFAERAEKGIRRLQDEGRADAALDPELAALALGAMVGRFAELWLVGGWGEFDLDEVAEQITRLWANAIGLGAELEGFGSAAG